MAGNDTLLAAYQEIIDRKTEARKDLGPVFIQNDVYERVIEIMRTDPEKFEELALSPTLKIELGLYLKLKEAHEALQALEKEATSGN